jgi:hypothetical protein
LSDESRTEIELIGIRGAPSYMAGGVKINGVHVAAESIHVAGHVTGSRDDSDDPLVSVTLKLIPSALVFSEPEE